MTTIGTKGLAKALGISKDAADRMVSRKDFPANVATESTGQRGGRPEKRWRIVDLPKSLVIKGREVEVREVVRQWILQMAVLSATSAKQTPAPTLPALPIRTICHPADMSDRQRQVEGARKYVLAEVERLMLSAGCSREAAMHTLLTHAAAGEASAQVLHALRLARDGRGRKADAEQADGLPSVRTLKRWLAHGNDGAIGSLAPKIRVKTMDVPPWAKAFLTHYQKPQKPSVEAAYRDFKAEHVLMADGKLQPELPSIHAVRRFVGKIGAVTLERGRSGARELKNIRPFVRRSFDHLEPNDIWTADGHTFDAEVQHPYHGRPFRPEITSIVDIATRRIVGFSVGLAENATGVVDAMRHGIENNGILAMFYVDNGSGFANAMLSDEATGLAGRVGFGIEHSLPYNSQARGVIERLHQTVWVDAAKMLPSYMGAAMDREARLAHFKLTRAALKGSDGKTRQMPLMPWDVFMQFCEERVRWYNARAHRTLKGQSPDQRLAQFMDCGWQAMRMAEHELDSLFRPRVERTLARGEIVLFTNIYACPHLEEFHGERVQVAYDIHKPEKIWVYTPEGRLMGEAIADGNRRHYYTVPVVQQHREKRAKAREKRVDVHRDEIRAELYGNLLDAPNALHAAGKIDLGTRVMSMAEATERGRVLLASDQNPAPLKLADADTANEAPVARVLRSKRSVAENMAEWEEVDARILAGKWVDENQAYWHESYQHTHQFKSEMARRAEEKELAQEQAARDAEIQARRESLVLMTMEGV